MRRSMKTAWPVLVASIFVLALASAILLGVTDQDAAGEPESASVDALQRPGVQKGPVPAEQEAELEPGFTAPEAFARRLVHVPDTRLADERGGPTTDERDIKAENIESLVQENLVRALEGEMASAWFAAQARRACQGFAGSPEELEKRIERTNRKAERDIKRGRELPEQDGGRVPYAISPNPDVNRTNLQNWYEACQHVRGLFGPDFRDQLERQALDGNVNARYLYAVWPPETLDIGGAFEQQYHWEDLAREFSRLNLETGEVAGPLAFAESYRRGLFTAESDNLALAFTFAAFKCGFDAATMGGFLEERINRLSASDDPADQQRLQAVLLEADQLSAYCR
jgi:hypothetical protein